MGRTIFITITVLAMVFILGACAKPTVAPAPESAPATAAAPTAEPEPAPPPPPPASAPAETPTSPWEVRLPEPREVSDTSIEEALLNRRSIRDYTGGALTLEEVSQLLWAAQGTTSPKGYRTAPSALAIYTLETYLVVGDVENLSEGVYRYKSAEHMLVMVLEGDYRPQLTRASVGQYFVEGGAAYILFTGVYERITVMTGEQGVMYVHMEVGHAAQNVYLQAVALGLGTVVNGGIDADRIREILQLPESETPLYFMPVGRK